MSARRFTSSLLASRMAAEMARASVARKARASMVTMPVEESSETSTMRFQCSMSSSTGWSSPSENTQSSGARFQ